MICQQLLNIRKLAVVMSVNVDWLSTIRTEHTTFSVYILAERLQANQ
jgi:hypothetical protein